MKIEEMKRIAEARTFKDKWVASIGVFWDVHLKNNMLVSEGSTEANAKFIAMAANNWDKLMAVVDTLRNINYATNLSDEYFESERKKTSLVHDIECIHLMSREALEALEK